MWILFQEATQQDVIPITRQLNFLDGEKEEFDLVSGQKLSDEDVWQYRRKVGQWNGYVPSSFTMSKNLFRFGPNLYIHFRRVDDASLFLPRRIRILKEDMSKETTSNVELLYTFVYKGEKLILSGQDIEFAN